MTIGVVETSFTSAVAGEPILVTNEMNISLDFTTGSGIGTVVLQRSFDKGATWKPGVIETYTEDTEKRGDSLEPIHYRFNCIIYTSGTISTRLSY